MSILSRNSGFVTLDQVVDELYEDQQTWRDNDGSLVWGLDTGFKTINYATGGLHEGEVTLVLARTSHGKSALTTQLAMNIASNLHSLSAGTGDNEGMVFMLSPEMRAKDLVLRRTSAMAQVESYRLKRNQVTDTELHRWHTELEKARALTEHVQIAAGRSMDIYEAIQMIEEIVTMSDVPPKLVIFDYMQKFGANGKWQGHERTSEVSRACADLAHALNVPVIVATQAKRSDDGDSEPTMFDVREGGRAEEDADNVWVLHREKMLSSDTHAVMKTSKAKLKIEKQRAGPQAVIPLVFVQSLTLFREPSVDKVRIDGMD